MTVGELLVRFLAHARTYYRRPDDTPTNEISEFTHALRPVNHLYGLVAVEDFGALKLKNVRELMMQGYHHPQFGQQEPLCRGVINKRVRRIVQVFKWGVGEELAPVEVWQSLKAVPGLKAGRSAARETEPVKPVAVELVEATLPQLTLHLRGAVRFQLLTGARPGEAVAVRLADIDRSNPVWIYRPAQHKTRHHGKTRVVAIGPRGQAVLLEFIRVECPLCGVQGRPPRIGSRDGCICGPCADRMDEQGICGPWPRCELQPPDAFLFSPRDSVAESKQDRRTRRKSKVQPSQQCRKKKKPRRAPGSRYSGSSYAAAVLLACDRAGIERWHPNRLRHTHGTLVRQQFGLEAAQTALGHAQANVTEIYAERDLNLAIEVASKIG